jgi:hypothetical protein
MWQVLVSRAQQFLDQARLMGQDSVASAPSPLLAFPPVDQVVLTDGVGRTLFDGFADHLRGDRHDQETGWLLLGLRQQHQAIVQAALPAGHQRQASRTHVRFNTTAQALGSRILRQLDRRLTILGVAHTHPGSLRRPSKGDLRGDRAWVRQLRGGEGVFAIGTADGPVDSTESAAARPRPNAQCQGGLRFSWYALRQGEGRYRPLAVEWTLGPDLAHELQGVWRTVEEHAERLERLLRQQAAFRIEIVAGGLSLTLPLAEEGACLRVVLRGTDVRYYTERRGELAECQPGDGRVDRGVYLLLAELSGGGQELSR